jgi:hypothetical protein
MKTGTCSKVCGALLAVGLGWGAPAPALAQQWFPQSTYSNGGYSFNNPISASISSMLSYPRIRDLPTAAGGRARGQQSQSPGVSRPRRIAGGTTSFVPGRRAVLDRAEGPQRQQLAKVLTDCDKLYVTTMNQAGVDSGLNDLASSTAFHIAIVHHVYWSDQAGAPPEPQPAHMKNLRDELRERYIASGTLLGKSDLEKQAAQDGLVVSACIPLARYSQAKKQGNEAAKQAVRKQAADLLAKVGLSPTTVRFNPDGSVKVGRAE